MNVKEYLETLTEMKDYINQEARDLESIRCAAEGIGCVHYTEGKVQTSHTGKARYTTLVEKMADLEQQIRDDTAAYNIKRKEITSQIEKIENQFYKDLLYRRYIDGMKLKDIAKATGFSYSYITHSQQKAVKAFEKIYADPETQAKNEEQDLNQSSDP